jgi:DNA-binding transcriptional LysR family regulator
MRIEQLNYLVVVAQFGSINKASEKLFVSQPAISSAIKSLEDELHVKLLTRTHSGVIPTIHGERVITDAEKILSTMKSWGELSGASAMKPLISIDFTGPSSDMPLFNLFFRMKELYPSIAIRLNYYNKPILEMDSDAPIIHACSSNKLAKLLSCGRKNYRVSLLFEDKYKLFMRADNPLAEKPYVHVSDLRSIKIATRSRPSTFPYHNILSELSNEMVYLGDVAIVFSAVALNYAVALLPAIPAEKHIMIEQKQVYCKDIVDVNFPFYHYLLTPLDRILTTEERIVYNYLNLHYAELIT